MAHLGYLLTALADGQLSPATTERVLEHVAACPPCAAELAAERRARLILAEAECESAGADLAARLRTICEQHETVPREVEPAASHPARRAVAWTSLGTVLGASALAACLFVIGAPRDAGPLYGGSSALASLGTVADAAPAGLEVQTAATAITPAGLPDGVFTVTGQRQVGQATVVELSGRRGHVVLAVQRGRLDPSSVDHLGPVDVFGAPRFVLSTEPWHAVWQSGDEVVELVTDLPPQQVAELVAHFPTQDYDANLTARLSRGWELVTEGWSR